MKSKTFVMMFVAIGCGLVAAYLTARITAKQATPDTVPVLVAREKIRAGEVIKEPEKFFVEMRYPAGTTPNAITNLDEMKGKMVNKTLQPGQWLTPDDLSSNFGIELPKGYYAMSVKVSPETGASGFILPKSRVNVVATLRDRQTGRARVVTVLQDVLVLAVDTTYVRPEDKMAVPQLNTALLAVKPSESQRLTLASSLSGGDLRLVLRGHDDDSRVPLPPLSDLEHDSAVQGEGSEPTPPAPVFKLAVAKADIQPGTVVNNPEELFKVETFAVAPENAVAADDLAGLKGKTVQHSLFKDGVLTSKHFTGGAVAAKPKPKVDVNRHVMYIQNGGQAPQKVTYENGIAVLGESKPTLMPPANPPAEKPEPTAAPADGPVSKAS